MNGETDGLGYTEPEPDNFTGYIVPDALADAPWTLEDVMRELAFIRSEQTAQRGILDQFLSQFKAAQAQLPAVAKELQAQMSRTPFGRGALKALGLPTQDDTRG